MMEHSVRKCNMPKKIKLFLSIKKVANEITAERIINLTIRIENLALKFLEKVRILPDIPEIVIKLTPITWAASKPTPCITVPKSIKPK